MTTMIYIDCRGHHVALVTAIRACARCSWSGCHLLTHNVPGLCYTWDVQQACRSNLTAPGAGGLGASCIRTFVPVEQPRRQLHICQRHAVVPVPECQQHGSCFASTCKRITVLHEMRLVEMQGCIKVYTGAGSMAHSRG